MSPGKRPPADADLMALTVEERIRSAIVIVRGERVMLDADLAALYGVQTKALLQAVRRNRARFPPDFMFQLTVAEARSRSQIVTLNAQQSEMIQKSARSSDPNRRGTNIKHLPHAFTEQGVAMLSSVLRSPRAIAVNVEIMRAFVRLRQMLASNAELAKKLAALEKKYDAQFRIVFDAIRELMEPPDGPPAKGRIGF